MMWKLVEGLLAWSIANPVAADAITVCLQLLGVAVLVELLSRVAIKRDVVLRHRLWRVVVVLALVVIPLHLSAAYFGFSITIPRLSKTSVGAFEPERHLVQSPVSSDVVQNEVLQADQVASNERTKSSESVIHSGYIPTESMATNAPLAQSSYPAGNWFSWLATVYLVGVFLLLSRIAFAYLALKFKASRMPEIDHSALAQIKHLSRQLECSEPYTVVASESTPSPYIFGSIRPILVLPNGFEGWSDQERAAVLAHELAHIQRKDFAWSLVSKIMTAVYWPHPASWWVNRRIVETREQAADECAVSNLVSRQEYARSLVRVIERFSDELSPRPKTSSLAITMSAFDNMQERIKAVLVGRVTTKSSRRWLVRSCLTLAMLCVVLCTLRLREAEAQEKVAQSASQKSDVSQSTLQFSIDDQKPGPQDNDLIHLILNCKVQPPTDSADVITMNYKGKIVDAEGNPVQDATVVILDSSLNYRVAARPELGDALKDKQFARFPSIVAKTTTAPDGSYEFKGVKSLPLDGVQPHRWEGEIVACQRDKGVMWDSLNYSNAGVVNRENLKLAGLRTVSGVFKSPDGSPLNNAVISLANLSAYDSGRRKDSVRLGFCELNPLVLTDSTGQFSFHRLPESAVAGITCKHANWGITTAMIQTSELRPTDWRAQSPLQVSPATIIAEKDFIFRGRITDENGQPISGADVFVDNNSRSATTDTDGNYEYQISRDHAKSLSERSDISARVVPPQGSKYLEERVSISKIDTSADSCIMNAQLKEGVHVFGMIVDELDKPARGVQIDIFSSDGGNHSKALSDKDGQYSLYVPAQAGHVVFSNGDVSYELPASPDVAQFLPVIKRQQGEFEWPVNWKHVDIDTTSRMPIELTPIHVVRMKPFNITVEGIDGSPVAATEVFLEDYVRRIGQKDEYPTRVSQSMPTNSKGEIQLIPKSFITDRASAIATYLSADGITFQVKSLLSGARDGKLILKAKDQPVIRGRVLLSGVPVAGATINLGSSIRFLDANGNLTNRGQSRSIMLGQTDVQGYYAVSPAQIDDSFVGVSSLPGYGNVMNYRLTVASPTKNGNEWRMPDLVVNLYREQLSGVVVDGDDNPIANANVRIGRKSKPDNWLGYSETRTNADGRFTLKNIPQGKHVIEASIRQGERFIVSEFEANAGDDHLRLQLISRPSPEIKRLNPVSIQPIGQ